MCCALSAECKRMMSGAGGGGAVAPPAGGGAQRIIPQLAMQQPPAGLSVLNPGVICVLISLYLQSLLEREIIHAIALLVLCVLVSTHVNFVLDKSPIIRICHC